MSRSITIRRDRSVPIETRLLKQIGSALLRDSLGLENFDLGVHLVCADEMTVINETFLRHKGPTDVITFNYSELKTQNLRLKTFLHGEIFICYAEAILQARKFRTRWQSEILRYLIHGVLHLLGFDDNNYTNRKKMKLEENRLLRELTRRFAISKLARRRSSP